MSVLWKAALATRGSKDYYMLSTGKDKELREIWLYKANRQSRIYVGNEELKWLELWKWRVQQILGVISSSVTFLVPEEKRRK